MHQPDKKTLCFIHGWFFDSRVFIRLIDQLNDIYQITLLDLPGYGTQSQKQGAITLADMTKDLTNRVPRGAVLVGWSFGAQVAINIAKYSGDHVRGLIVLAGTPCFVKKPDWTCGMDAQSLGNMIDRLSFLSGDVVKEFSWMVAQGDVSPRRTLRYLLSFEGLSNTETLKNGLELLQQTDSRNDFAGLSCPVAILAGENDQLVSRESVLQTRELNPGIQISMIEKTGHAPFISRPEYTAYKLYELIEKMEYATV